jgi:hypothetical protein
VPQLSADIQIPEFCYSGEEDDIDINVWIGQPVLEPLVAMPHLG